MALNAMNKKPTIVSVETIGADSFTQSYQAGEIIELEAITSIAKTLGARKTVPIIYDNLAPLVDYALTVTDAEAVKAMGDILEKEKLLVEPATSCNISAALQNKDLFKGKKVVIVVCGSNVTLDEYLNWKEEFDV